MADYPGAIQLLNNHLKYRLIGQMIFTSKFKSSIIEAQQNIVLPSRCRIDASNIFAKRHPRAWTNLLRRLIMDSLHPRDPFQQSFPFDDAPTETTKVRKNKSSYWKIVSKQCSICEINFEDARGRVNKCRQCRVRKHSEETKAKMSESKKGKKRSEETVQKMRERQKTWKPSKEMLEKASLANRGRKMSPENKEKLIESRKNYKASDETRAKISKSHENRTSYRRGFTVSEETKDKMRKARENRIMRPHTEETKAKISASNKGKHSWMTGRNHTEKTKEKIKQSHIQRLENMNIEEYRHYIEEKTKFSYYKMTDTKPELAVQNELKLEGILFETQKRIGRYMVDIYLPSKNLVIEVNGCVVHGCEQCGHDKDWQLERRKKDADRIEIIKSKGYDILVIWEHELIERGLL